MAQKILVELLDDIDGSPAVETFEFTHNGVTYVADFNQKHYDEYTQMFEYLTSIARVVKGKKRAPYGSKKGVTPVVGKTQEMREWLRAAGHSVKDRGRVPAHLVKLWEERPQGEVTVIREDDMREVAKSFKETPEKPVEAVKVEEAPKAPKKATTPRTRPTQSPAKKELAKLLAFEEPKTTTRKPRASRAKASTDKV